MPNGPSNPMYSSGKYTCRHLEVFVYLSALLITDEWSHLDWFKYIAKTAKNCSINLALNNETTRVNVPNNIKVKILVGNNN